MFPAHRPSPQSGLHRGFAVLFSEKRLCSSVLLNVYFVRTISIRSGIIFDLFIIGKMHSSNVFLLSFIYQLGMRFSLDFGGSFFGIIAVLHLLGHIISLLAPRQSADNMLKNP
jgi:hypothetical protein